MPFTIDGKWVPNESETDKKNKKPVRVYLEKRKGQFVTLIKNIDEDKVDLKELTRKIKQQCACGGTTKNSVIEIQGNKLIKVEEFLKSEKLMK